MRIRYPTCKISRLEGSRNWTPEQIAENRKTAHKVPFTSNDLSNDLPERLGPITMARQEEKNFTRPAETRGKFNDGGRTIKNAPKMLYMTKEVGQIGRGDTCLASLVKLIASANLQPVL